MLIQSVIIIMNSLLLFKVFEIMWRRLLYVDQGSVKRKVTNILTAPSSEVSHKNNVGEKHIFSVQNVKL